MVCSRVQPAGAPSVPLREFTVMNSTIVSPAWMPAGSVMCASVRLPALLAAATNDSTGSAALAAGTGLSPKTASALDQRRDEDWDETRARTRRHLECRHAWNPRFFGPSSREPVPYLQPNVVFSPTRARNGSSPGPGVLAFLPGYGAETVKVFVMLAVLPQPSVVVSSTV